MTGLVDNVPGAGKTWTPDFNGPGLVLIRGGGQSGASGQAITRGGKGGDGGFLCVDLQTFSTATAVTYTIGAGGAQVGWAGGAGFPGLPGGDSFFGGGTTCYAPGGGSTGSPEGRAKIPGESGVTPGSGDWNGGAGGSAPSQGAYLGGTGGVNTSQGLGTAGAAPGGGGSGGGQSSAGDGSAGGNGGIVIIPATDATLPGYNLVGLDESYNFSAVGTYDDFAPAGDGLCYYEGVGSGGGARGGNTLSLQGGHGASGGAWMYRLRAVFKNVTYRRIVPAGGAGGVSGFGSPVSGTDGADASWTLTPLRVVSKRLTNNVAWVSTCAPGSSTAQKHGLLLGESVVVANVDATFNGTFTVTRVDSAADYDSATTYAAGNRVNTSTGDVYVSIQSSNTAHTPSSSPTWWLLDKADRLAVGYAKTASNVGVTAVTPGTTSVTLLAPFLVAKGGKASTANYNTGTLPVGGSAAAGTGDGGADGGRGCYVRAGGVVSTTDGGPSGGGALPLGEQGGWGGGSVLNSTGTAVGDAGPIPGAGGGGGAGQTGGTGGAGGRGAAVARWILELHGIWIPGPISLTGQRMSVTRVKVWTGSPGSEVAHTIATASIWDGPAGAVTSHSPHRVLTHPESLKRRYPAYLIGSGYNYTPYFDRDTGCFNWQSAIGTSLIDSMAANDLDCIVFGDSVSEGWTSFDGVATGTKDFAKAFVRLARDYLAGVVSGLAKGGTGQIRTNTVSGVDPEWSFSGWSAGDTHYVTSSTIANVATFTPGLDSAGVQITGNKVSVVYSGGGITVKNAGGTTIGTGAATAGLGTLARLEISMGTTAGHVININPTAAVATNLFSASVYKAGIRVHNMSQGGSQAGGGTGQAYWGPASGMTAPGNMTACYTQGVLYPSTSGRPRCYFIFLGGNDSNSGVSAATISAAFGRVIDMIQAADPTAKIVLCPDVWTSDRVVSLMALARTKNVGMIDFFYLSRGLLEIYGKDYNGDVFGHLNDTTGAQWAGGLMRDAFLHNPI